MESRGQTRAVSLQTWGSLFQATETLCPGKNDTFYSSVSSFSQQTSLLEHPGQKAVIKRLYFWSRFTHSHTHRNTYSHSHTLTHTLTPIHTHAYTNTLTYTHTTHTHSYANTHSHTRTHLIRHPEHSPSAPASGQPVPHPVPSPVPGELQSRNTREKSWALLPETLIVLEIY